MAGKKILIVEDNAIIAMETIDRVKRLGYGVSGIAATGRDAIRLAGAMQPDLILMDINLRGDMDGIEAAVEIMRRASVPVIYITAYSDEDILKRAMASKPFRYLVKPYKERDLYTSIEEALGDVPGTAQQPVVHDHHRTFAEYLEECEDGVIAVDAAGMVRYLNPRAEAMTGWSRQDIAGTPLSGILIPWQEEDTRTGCPGSTAIPSQFSGSLVSASGREVRACFAWIGPAGGRAISPPGFVVFWKKAGGSS